MTDPYDGPIEWRNRRGKSKWQPVLANGERLWTVKAGTEDWTVPLSVGTPVGYDPFLTSERKALWIAAKEARRRVKKKEDEFREVWREQ